MTKNRLEAFSDGVLAIAITIMVLELKIPRGSSLGDLAPMAPVFSSYVLSFVYLGIYWNNHHHLLHATSRVNGTILWANLHLLFWLSLVPFASGWMGENHYRLFPVLAYGLVLFMAAVAYEILTLALVRHHGPDSLLARAIGSDRKGWGSMALYLSALGLAFVTPWAAVAVYWVVAVIWFVPDRRIESLLKEQGERP